jgi:16S rRNA G966 N2-methylase RsmD
MNGRRRSLAQRGGRISENGDPEWSAPLAAALAAADGGATDDLTHGFHAYPARMHPVLAREVLARFTEPGQIVLDPFAGSGTVLIEAMVAGCRAQGVDLSPLASRVAEQQCALRDSRSRTRFVSVLDHVAQLSEERVRSRAPVDVPIPRSEREYYEPHVMLELSGLWAEIQQLLDGPDKRALELVFSALVVKFSRQLADTNEEQTPKRIRKGLVTEFFARKGHELVMRWEALWDAVPDRKLVPRFQQGDARQLPELLGVEFRADLVLTSPPYGGTYDYADHHARRTAWLKLDVQELRTHEIGARRNLSEQRESLRARDAREAKAAAAAREHKAPAARKPAAGPSKLPMPGKRDKHAERRERRREPLSRWDRELTQVLSSIRHTLNKDSALIMWLGDAELGGTRVDADEQLQRLAPDADLDLVAAASQERQDMRGGAPRREHLLLLRAR